MSERYTTIFGQTRKNESNIQFVILENRHLEFKEGESKSGQRVKIHSSIYFLQTL